MLKYVLKAQQMKEQQEGENFFSIQKYNQKISLKQG